jgi:excinuclease ABC subunit C
MLESILDEIEQLGPSRRNALLERFGSVAALKKASVEDIAMTPGIGEKIALIVFDFLARSSTSKIDMATGVIEDA